MGLTNTSNTTPELEKGLQSLAETFVDQKTLGYLLETLDHVRIEKVSNKRYQTKKKENILLVNTDTNAIWGNYTLFLPSKLPVWELLFLISHLHETFGLTQYARIDETISKIAILVWYLINNENKKIKNEEKNKKNENKDIKNEEKDKDKNETNQESSNLSHIYETFWLTQYARISEIVYKIATFVWYKNKDKNATNQKSSNQKSSNQESSNPWIQKIKALLDPISDKYGITDEFKKAIQDYKIKPTAKNREFIAYLLENNTNKDKIWNIVERWTQDLTTNLTKELDRTFLRKWENLLRRGMETITQAEQWAVQEKQKQMEENNQPWKIRTRVETDTLDEKAQLLRDKIQIDKRKEKLATARANNNTAEINKIELAATNAIIARLYEYPCQNTPDNHGYQPPKIQKYKEIYCVGFSLLGHAFLSELGIRHQWLNIPSHSALSINIWDKLYYFDATVDQEVHEYIYGESMGAYRKIKLESVSFNEDIYAYPWDPEDILLAQLYNNKWISLAKPGQRDEAIDMYDKAIELDPKDGGAYNNKWVSLNKLGKYDEAIDMYDNAIELDPNNSAAYNNKWVSLDDLGKYEKAIDMYDKAIALDPKYSSAYKNKWISLAKLKKHKEAAIYYYTYRVLTNKIPTWTAQTLLQKTINEFITNKDFEWLRCYLLEPTTQDNALQKNILTDIRVFLAELFSK